MNTIVEHLNSAGFSFVEFALPMLIQSSVLIAILLLVDLLLRKKVKAVFRYWIWMLVLLKLVLPTSLSSPLSLGYLFGDKLTYQDLAQSSATLEPTESAPADISPGIEPLFIQPNPYIPPPEPVISVFEPAIAEPVSPPEVPVTPLTWQGVVFLVWLVVVIAMGLLLLQRALFVRGLVAQAKKAGRLMNDALAYCCASMGIKSKVGLKVSVNATTPSVCGLIRPVILVPWNLTSTLGVSRMRTVLMHELAHIRRGDLWVNLAQTALQIIYFYNPLLWLANCVIRRVREQAVDEAVLVAMGEKAQRYPQTLVDVAKMTFKRPALSLRLIGVVESKSALAGRIKHILGRPMPKTAKLGIIGLLAVIIAGAVLLPMAKGQSSRIGLFDRKTLVKFESDDKPTGVYHKIGGIDIYQRTYKVDFKKNEKLVVIAELYQVGKPMRRLGCKVFDSSNKTQDLSVTLKSKYLNDIKTSVGHNIEVKMNDQSLRIDSVKVDTPTFFNNQTWDFFDRFSTKNGAVIRIEERYGNKYVELNSLAMLRAYENFDTVKGRATRIWMPTYNNVSWVDSNAYFIQVNMFPLSQLEQLDIDVPRIAEKMQLPDGSYLPAAASKDVCKAVAEKYYEDIKLEIIRQSMLLPMAAGKDDEGASEDIAKASEFIATLPNDVTVELVGVCELPSEGKQWWAADGNLLEDIFWEGSNANRESSVDARQVVFRIRSDESDPALAPTISFHPKRRLQPPGSWSGAFFVEKDNQTLEELRGCSFSLHDDQKSIDISADIGYGPWKTLTKLAMNSDISLPKPVFTDIGYLTWNEPAEEGGKTTVSATLFDAVKVWRIVAVDKQGDIHVSNTALGQGFDGHQIVKATFSLPLSRIEKFRFQTRPFGEITFKNVSLEPNFKTDVQVEVEEAEPVLAEAIEAAKAGISLPVRKIFSGKTDKGGSFEWETSIDPRVRFRHGWYFFEDGVVKGYVGAGASQIPEEGRINLKLDVEVKDNMLNLKVQRIEDLDDGSRTAAVAGKTSVPDGAYLKHDNSIDSAVLTNKHLTLWQGDFIRDDKVVKSVIYAAYFTTPDDRETGFEPPLLQKKEFVTAKDKPAVPVWVKETTISPTKLVMLLILVNSCAPETELNIESISITARNISIRGDTSGRPNTQKFLDAIRKNELKILQLRLDAGDNRDKFSIIVDPEKDWQQRWRLHKNDVQLGVEETISPKLVMLLGAINSCAAETKLNIESISIKAREINIKGDTSSRTNSQKFLDSIKKNELEVLRLNLDTRNNRDRFSMVVEPKKDWQKWWQKHKTDIEADFPTKEDVVSKPPQPELLSAKPPIFAYDVKLNFADPTVRDGTFHSEQSIAFSLSFHNIEIPPAGKFTLGHLLIGQTTWPVHLEDNGITVKEGVAGQKVLSLTWPAGESEFEKVIKIPVKYGQKEYSCPVRVELDRRAEGDPIGSYWFCAYLSGRLPWGAGGSRFEIVNLDQQMEFRLTGDGTDPRDAVLGIDIDGDGRIDPAKTGGEQFDLYEPFQIGPKTYRLAEVDPYLPRVVFRELVSEKSHKPPAKTDVQVEDMKERIARGPEQVRAIGELLRGWFDGCVTGDVSLMKEAYPSPDHPMIEDHLHDMKEVLGLNPSWQFSLLSAMWDKEKAMAVSGALEHGDPKVGAPMVLVWKFRNSEGKWGIVDIDLEELEGLQIENSRFMQKHPNSQVWFDNPDLNAPKMRQKTAVPVEGEGAEAVSGESEVTASEDGPRITFESLVCDLGRIPPSTKHVCEFKYTNTGNALLKITRVGAACACTVPQKTKECAPGESGTLKVTYQSAAHAGRVTKYVVVYCNDEVNPKVKLTIKAEIVVKVAHEPERLNVLLKGENAGCPPITLTSLDNQPFSITDFKSTGDSITADFDSSVNETSLVIQPKADMEKLRKGLKGQIEISLTHPECKKLIMIFDALSEFKADPRVVYVREAEPLKPVTKIVRVFSNYNEDVEIESTSSKKGTVKVLTQEKVRNGCQFELEITPPEQESKRRVFTDKFSVMLKGGQQLQITCYGIYSKKPAKTIEESVPETDVQIEGEREKDTSARKRTEFFGLDLTDTPRTTKWADLPDLFEARPPGSKSYHRREDVDVVYAGLDGTVYYIPNKKIFYVQHDKMGASTLHYYGPFDGDPYVVLKLQTYPDYFYSNLPVLKSRPTIFPAKDFTTLRYEINMNGVPTAARKDYAERVIDTLKRKIDREDEFKLVWKAVGEDKIEVTIPKDSEQRMKSIWGKVVDGIAYAVRPVKGTFLVGELLEFDVIYKNISLQPITVCVFPDPFYVWTRLWVFDSSGTWVASGQHASGLQPFISSSHFVTLRPGETTSVRQNIRLSPKSLLKPGRYIVFASVNKINPMWEHIVGFDEFCHKNNLTPWAAVVETGRSSFTIVSNPDYRQGEAVNGQV